MLKNPNLNLKSSIALRVVLLLFSFAALVLGYTNFNPIVRLMYLTIWGKYMAFFSAITALLLDVKRYNI